MISPTPEQIRERLNGYAYKALMLASMGSGPVRNALLKFSEGFKQALSLLDQRDAEIAEAWHGGWKAAEARAEASLLRMTEERDRLALVDALGPNVPWNRSASITRQQENAHATTGSGSGVGEGSRGVDGQQASARCDDAQKRGRRGTDGAVSGTVGGGQGSGPGDREGGLRGYSERGLAEALRSDLARLTEAHEQLRTKMLRYVDLDLMGDYEALVERVQGWLSDLDALLAPPEEKKDER